MFDNDKPRYAGRRLELFGEKARGKKMSVGYSKKSVRRRTSKTNEKGEITFIEIEDEDGRIRYEEIQTNKSGEIVRKVIYRDLRGFSTTSAPPTRLQTGRFLSAAKIIDLILEPEAAESAIGDLAEGFQRRAPLAGGHATRWLWVQVGWIAFDRALKVLSSVVRARAGK